MNHKKVILINTFLKSHKCKIDLKWISKPQFADYILPLPLIYNQFNSHAHPRTKKVGHGLKIRSIHPKVRVTTGMSA